MDIKEKNAEITDASLGFAHGSLTAWLYLKFQDGNQAFGGYVLGGEYLDLFITRVLETVNVKNWEGLPGKFIKIRASHDKVHEIANIIDDKWFNPKEEFAALKAGASS